MTTNKMPSSGNAQQNTTQLLKSLPGELKALLLQQWDAKQNPKWHPEGNTLKHIITVVRRAFKNYPDDPTMIMAALFHDLGKLATYKIDPKTGNPTAHGHEKSSVDIVDKYRSYIESFEGVDADDVKHIVQHHMVIKPQTWDVMKASKKEKIADHPAFGKLEKFKTLDKGGLDF